MRQKVKRYSRSAISILLTLCMLVSCMTVGIIATDAAKISSDEAVGYSIYDQQYLYVDISALPNWDLSGINVSWKGDDGDYADIDHNWLTNKTSMGNNVYRFDLSEADSDYKYFRGFQVVSGGTTFWAGYNGTGNMIVVNDQWNGNTWTTYSPTPYLHYCTGSGQPLHDNTATNVAMTHSSGDVYTYTLNAGDYYINIDGNSGQAGQALGISSVVVSSGVTHVQNNAWGGYNFSQIKSDSKMLLSFNNSTKILTVSPVLTNVMLDDFVGGTATVKQGSTTIAEDETKGLQPGSVATVTVKMDNDTDKTDSFRLSSDATNPVTMKYVGDRTYRGTFTVPETASTVNVTLATKRAKAGPFTVTYQSEDEAKGTVTASVANGASVTEDTLVTFTATPVKPYEFAGWTGLTDATTAGVTVPVTSNLNVTGNFSKKAYSLVTYAAGNSTTGTSTAMTQLSNGYYRSSVKVKNTGDTGQFFTVSRTLGTTTTYAKSGLDEGDKWWITTARPGVSPQHWTSNATVSQKYKDAVGATNEQHYVFYDPDTNKIWLSTNPDGVTSKIKIYAKDGAMKEANGGTADTSTWGNTTLTVKVDTTAKTVDSSQYGGHVELAEIDAAEAVNPKTVITVETTITRANAGNYYVYGYDVNGYTVKAEHVSGNQYKATFSVPSIQANINGGIEITPIYLLKEPDSGNPTTTRFYVYNFSGDVKSRWGGSLYCYSYDSNGDFNYGDWPGQPMINLGGGTYYIDLPKGSHSVTLSNASADFIHATILGVKLDGNDTWKTRNMYQCQSYDYDDFDYISQKPVVQATDEDIVFDFKYKTEGNNFPDAKGTNEAAFATLYPTLYVSDYTNWETLTNFYGDPVDLWGTEVTANNLNKNPVRVVVQGYHDTHGENKSYYSTAYVVYVPDSETGDANYTIVNYDGTNRYGYKSRSEFLQKTAAEMGLSAYAGRPVQITYEYAIYDQYSTNGGSAGANQTAERADGVWYYSQSRPVKSEIKIQYANTKNDTFTDDSFADVTPQVLDKEGNPYQVNQGTTTHAKAFFTDNNFNDNQAHRPSGPTTPPEVLDVDYDNRVIEWAYTDGNEKFEITAQESPDGEYSFLGWYKQSGDHVEFVTADYNYSTEAVRGETFIARYVKSPAGQVKLLHSDVEPGSGGTGIRKVEYDIVNASGHSVLDSSEVKESTNGAITVPKHYINSHSTYTLKAKFTIESNGNGATNGFYGEEAGGNSNLLTVTNFASHNGITDSSYIQNMTTGINTGTTVVEFSIPISGMFKYNTAGDKEFDDNFSLLEMFSDFLPIPTRDITITKTTDVDDYGTAFKIKIYKGTSASDISTPVTDAIPYVNAHNGNGNKIATDGEYTIFKGDVLTLSGIQDGTYVKVVELKKGTNAPDATNFYKFDNTVTCTAQANSTSVGTDVRTANEIGTTFRVNGAPVAVTIDNKIQRQNVTITKITNFEEEGSEFTIHVDARLHNSAETARQPMSSTFYTTATVKEDPDATVQTVTTQTSGDFVVKKDGVITFTGVPKGTFLTITEPIGKIYSYSTITGLASDKTASDVEPKGVGRFTLSSITNGDSTEPINGAYQVIADSNLKVNNTVKMTTLKVTKALLDNVTSNAEHKFKLTVKKSGKESTPTNTTYDTISYESKYNDVTTTHTNVNLSNEISIRQGEELTFSVPYGAYITIQETTPADGFRFDSFDLTNAAATPAAVTEGNTISFQTTDSAATCEIRNKKLQTLTITKTVSGLDASDQSFEVLVKTGTASNSLTAYNGAYGGTNSGTTTDGIIRLKNGENATITLDYGTYVEVTEIAPASGKYVPTYSTGLTFPIQMNTDRAVDITNTVQTKDIIIKKTTDIAEPDQAFDFTVNAVENSKPSAAVDLSGLTCEVYNSNNTKDNSATVTKSSAQIAFSLKKDQYLKITGVPVDVKLTITETLPSGQDYQLGSVTGATQTTGTTSATYVVPKTDPSEIVFNNTKGKTLTIKKTATGGDNNDEFTIHVETGSTPAAFSGSYTLTRGATSTELSTTNGDITMKRDDEVTISGIAKGTQFRVTEADKTGYMIKNITCDVTGAANYPTSGTVTGKTFTIEEANGEITFDNVKTHDVTITKNLENSNSNQKFQISVDLRLYGEDGTSQTTWLRSVANATATTASLSNMEISEGEYIVLKNVPVGAYITVTEAAQTNFTCRTITAVDSGSNNIADTDTTNNNVFTFTLGDTDPTITVYNKINTRTVNIAKEIDTGVYPTSGSFTVNVKVNGFDYTDNNITGGNITFSNASHDPVAITVPLDATVAVAEATGTGNMPAGYAYDYTILGTDNTTKVTNNAFTKTFAIADADNQTITVHNTQLKKLTLTKEVDFALSGKTFTFEVYKKNTSDNYEKVGSDVTFNGAEIKEFDTWFRKGDVLKVVEKNIPEEYEFKRANNATTNVTNGGSAIGAVDDSTNGKYGFENIVVQESAAPTVTIKNNIKTKTVTVEKQADYEVSNNFEFSATYKQWDATNNEYADRTETFSLANNGTKDLTNIPVGSEVTVAETNKQGATSVTADFTNNITTHSFVEGTGSANPTATLTVANSDDTQKVTFKNSSAKLLTISKITDDTDLGTDTTNFLIKVEKKGASDFALYTGDFKIGSNTYTGVTNDKRNSDGNIIIHKGESIEIEVQQNDEFRVSEIIGSDSNYTLVNVSNPSNASDVVNITSGTDTIGKQFKVGTQSIAMSFKNNIKRSKIYVKKDVSNFENDPQKFNINIAYTKPGGATGSQAFIDMVEGTTSSTYVELPVGSTIVVSEGAVSGYAWENTEVKSGDGDATISGTAVQNGTTFTVGKQDSTITVTNKKLATLTITKAVSGVDNTGKSFEMLVKTGATASGTTAYSGSYTLSGVTGPNATTNGKISLTNGQSATIVLDYGTYVDVAETAPGDKYTVSYEPTGGSVQMNGDETITVTNTVNTRDVKIIKATDYSNTDDEFTFGVTAAENSQTVDLSGMTFKVYNAANEDVTGTTNTVSSFKLKKNYYAVITGVPVGVTLTVTETPASGYSLASVDGGTKSENSATVTVAKGTGTQDVTFTNSKTKTLTISKTTDFAADTTSEFSILVKQGGNNYSGSNYKVYKGNVEQTERTFSDGVIKLKNGERVVISDIASGTQFTVEETGLTDTSKYKLDRVECNIKDNFANGDEITINETDATVAFTNSIKKGTVTINKSLFYNNAAYTGTDANGSFNIGIKMKSTGKSAAAFDESVSFTRTSSTGGTSVAYNATTVIANGETITISDVPVGAYLEVSENAPSSPHSFRSIDVTGATPETSADRTVAFTTVANGDTGTAAAVAIQNNVLKKSANVKIQYKDMAVHTTWQDDTYDTDGLTGVTSGAKVYFTGTDPLAKTMEAVEGKANAFIYTKDDNSDNLTSGYKFDGWYVVVGGVEKKIGNGTGETTEADAKKADNDKTFIARYVKAAAAGTITIQHLLTNDSPANSGDLQVSATVTNNAGTDTIHTADYTNGTISISGADKGIQYVNGSSNKLVITLKTKPNAHYSFVDFFENLEGTTALTNITTAKSTDGDNNTTVTITLNVNDFFKSESGSYVFDNTKSSVVRYSKLTANSYTGTIKIQYRDSVSDVYHDDTYSPNEFTTTTGVTTQADAKFTNGTGVNTRQTTVVYPGPYEYTATDTQTSTGYTFDGFFLDGTTPTKIGTGTDEIAAATANAADGAKTFIARYTKSTPDTYHYRIEYTYPSRKQYVKTTDAQGNEMQGLGEPMYGDQSYFVEGDLLSNNPSFSSYFNASANDGKGAITQDFIASLPLPKESNFMQDITWDTTQAATYGDFGVVTDIEGNVSYYTAKLKYSVADTSKKTVKFMFPYEYQQVDYEHGSLDDGKGVVYIPTSYSDAVYLGNNEDNWQTTDAKFVTYQNEFIAWKVESRLKENSETEYETYNQYYHTTAPSTIKNGGDTANFLYWSIRSKNKSTGNYEEIARSHNPIFNYTIFDDYLIIPVYSCFDSENYELSNETEFNASKTAWLNLLDITRNQWNNDAKGTESTSRHGKDTIYVDFDLAFCFNGYQLNKKTNAVDTGLLIEDCGVLDAEHQLNLAGDATTYKNDVVYYQSQKAVNEEAIKNFIRGNLVKGGFGSKTGGDYIKYTIGKSLTNKNRMELGVINTVRAIEESEENHIAGWTMTDETKRTHVFRAYSYVTRTAETGDTAVYLSEPVYFTLKNISEM